MGRILYPGQDAGTGGGKAGHCLKQGVHRVRDAARHHKRNGTHDGNDDPAQRGSSKALPHIEYLALGLDATQGVADGGADCRRDQKHAQHEPFAVESAGRCGQQQQRAFDHQHIAQQTENDRIIHSLPPSTLCALIQNIAQVMQTMLQRDHDHVVAHLDLVAAARDQDTDGRG